MVIKVGEKYELLRAAFNDIVFALEDEGRRLEFEEETKIAELLDYHFGAFLDNEISDEELEDHGWKEV